LPSKGGEIANAPLRHPNEIDRHIIRNESRTQQGFGRATHSSRQSELRIQLHRCRDRVGNEATRLVGAVILFNGMAGNRFRVRLAGSTVMPTDSRAVTPSSGSASSGPNTTRPAVISPMNLISTNPKENWCLVPSAHSYIVVPTGWTPICRSLAAGATQSVATVSTRKSASYVPLELPVPLKATVTCVSPI